MEDYNVMIDGEMFLMSQEKITQEHMTEIEKWLLVKEMITRLVVY